MRIFAGVYWGARQEALSKCAERLERHFAVLASISPTLSHWQRGEKRKTQAETQVDVRSPEGSAELLAHGVNRKDIGREAISELGFGVALWNGSGESWSAGTSVTCGLYSKNSNLSNVANLTVECKDEMAPHPSAMINLLKQLITVWDSDNGRLEQTYMPSNANMVAVEPQDILYASYATSDAECQESEGAVEPFGRGRLWTSSKSRWAGSAI